jgi:hypothetical protein
MAPRHPAYRRIFIGDPTSFFGNQLTAVAVPVQMYLLTRSSLWVGYIGIAGLVPLLIFALCLPCWRCSGTRRCCATAPAPTSAVHSLRSS